MFKIVVSALPVTLLPVQQLENAPAFFLGTAKEISKTFPRERHPEIVGSFRVESPDGKVVNYLTLLQLDTKTNKWVPVLEDPRVG